MRTGALERTVARAAARARAPRESCRLCAAAIGDAHPHLLDVDDDRPLCVCAACSVLFDRPLGGPRRYRRVPDRRRRLEGVRPADLRVPVGLAFFTVDDDGAVRAGYPSPAGATRWDVDPDDWAAVSQACPDLGSMAPHVEALLVNTVRGRSESWVVPVTDCFRLVGIVRSRWVGLSGGDRVWPEIERFFDELREVTWEPSGSVVPT